ncbi:MAG: ATP-binding cassette domain-containing protein [Lachnospiraceae bacterium]|nr:ATP-binding cassette domain-containing protein [Lachnospiraceae bacterium]
MIRLDRIQKYFNKGKSNEIHVINDISLDFPDHGMVAIFGRSGCGKTTLLNVIGGLDKVQKGSVFIEGQKMSANQDELRNQYIGYIFQNYCLNGNESCFDNVATSLRLCGMTDEEEIARRVHVALSAVGMDTFYKRVPNSLSGGQQQRIAIARALVKNPPIILADEPTGNLDEANTVVIMDILKQLSKTRLVLLVTHEENLVDYYCDSVIELSDGRVVGFRNNEENNGYIAKDKNTIYLGEYARQDFDNEAVHMSYYGELPENPVRVRMINRNGVLYMKVETSGVHVLDETSEVHLVKGRFEEQRKAAEEGEKIDLSALTAFQGSHYGKLFSFKDGVKSGISMISTMKKRKKMAKRLRRVMAFFAVVLVFVVARFGVGIKEYFEAKSNYNQDAILVYLETDSTQSDKLNKLFEVEKDPDSGIKRIVLDAMYAFIDGMDTFEVVPGAFETYSKGMLSFIANESDSFKAAVLPESDRPQVRLLSGKAKTEDTYEILITKNCADKLLKNPTFSFIRSYDDLIGMYCDSRLLNAKTMYTRLLRKVTNQTETETKKNWVYDPDSGMYYTYDAETDTYEYVDELPEDSEEVRHYFRIAGVLDSEEVAVYLNEDMFVQSTLAVDLPIPALRQYYGTAIVFSDQPERTARYLKNLNIHAVPVLEEIRRDLNNAKSEMFGYLTTMIAVLAVLCVCMYFIMRSIYMNRMKEIGIYRAIGVSKQNLMFRSFVETGVITTLSAFIGYLLTTGFLFYLRKFSAKTEELFYFPWWIALLVLGLIYVICLFTGTLSVRNVLRKTPAEIMAKYDI